MTKTELQTAIAEATQTDKRTAGAFLDTLSALAYKESKKNGEFVLPGFGKLVKQKRKARMGFTQTGLQHLKNVSGFKLDTYESAKTLWHYIFARSNG